jgi:threonine/homoserine/homoserine lactone efflux protein
MVLLLIAHLFSVLSPGPAFIGSVNTAISSGFKKAILFLIGIAIGDIMVFSITMFSLSEIIFREDKVRIAFYFLSGCYVLYFAYKILKNSSKKIIIEKKITNKSFIEGSIIGISNPKAFIFASSLLASYITPTTTLQIKIFIILLLTTLGFVYMILIVHIVSIYRSKALRYESIINKVFACFLCIFAFHLLYIALQNFNLLR